MPAPDSPGIAFVGAGRVARALSEAFLSTGLSVTTVSSRDPAAAQAAVDTHDFVFLTVTDHAISEVCQALRWPARTVAVHTSGAHGLEILAGAGRRASFHPMQSFPHASLPHALGRGITISIEADDDTAPWLEHLARSIHGNPLRLPAGARPVYHASGYFASPFLVTMLYQASLLWRNLGFDEASALATLLPLLKETVRMVEEHGLENSLTGLVIRGDCGTLARHRQELHAANPAVAEHYEYLMRISIDMAETTGSLSAGAAARLRETLTQR